MPSHVRRSNAPRSRGRPPRLDPETILEMAREIDPQEFSMPRLATQLGVTTQALYYYFSNRERLEEALAEAVLEKIPVVPDRGQGWQEHGREVALAIRRVLMRTGGAAERLRAGRRPKAGLRLMDRNIGVLTTQGFSDSDAIRVNDLITNFVIRSCAADTRRGRRRRVFSRDCEAAISELGEASVPQLSRLAKGGLRLEPEEAFERNLDDLLAGIASGLARRGGNKRSEKRNLEPKRP